MSHKPREFEMPIPRVTLAMCFGSLMLLLCPLGRADGDKIYFQVQKKASGDPVANTNVTVDLPGVSAVTTDRGVFYMPLPPLRVGGCGPLRKPSRTHAAAGPGRADISFPSRPEGPRKFGIAGDSPLRRA